LSDQVALGRELSSELEGRIFAAAFACLSEKGFDRTTMDDVAVRAGVARATLYYYFRGKDDLFLFLLRGGIAMLRASIDEALAPGGTAAERLERLLDRLVDLFVEYRDLTLVVFEQLARLHGNAEMHSWMNDQAGAPIIELLAEGVRDGSLNFVDPETTAPALFGAVSWAFLRYAMFDQAVPVETVKETLHQILLGGLRA
jgi:AcrR family transcriptional regulator